MKKSCGNCGDEFVIEANDLSFLDQVSPVIAGKKYELPEPNFCYKCRLQRRFSWRNDINLYKRKCDRTGVDLVSMFSPESDVIVYEHNFWWSDQWDARDFGRDFDFNRGFFEQFAELEREVPHAHLIVFNSENSLYTNYNTNVRNCYLCFAGNYSEDNLYCYNAEGSNDCVDCAFVWDSEILYQCVQCSKCYQCFYCLHCDNCSSSMFLDDCVGCQDCFMCANLRNKKFYFLNKKCASREEYEKKRDEFLSKGYEECRRIWKEERAKMPVRAAHNLQSEDCVGEYIWESKNCEDCYIMARGGEDCKHVFNGFPDLKDSQDCTYCGEKAELLYECLATGVNEARILFGNLCLEGSSELLYCSCVFGCKNCFGCSNLKQGEYCILNKQYTKSEYEEMVPRIIEQMKKIPVPGVGSEWGEFFPTATSPFCYNESSAGLYFPMERDEVVEKGWEWREIAEEIGGDVAGGARICEKSGKPFRFVKRELDFYERWALPEPRLCFIERHKERMKLMNEWEVRSARCARCGDVIRTGSQFEKVWCEKCYLGEVE